MGEIHFEDFTNYLIEKVPEACLDEKKLAPNHQLTGKNIQADQVCALNGNPHLVLLEGGKKNMILLDKKNYKQVTNISFGGVIINSLVYLS